MRQVGSEYLILYLCCFGFFLCFQPFIKMLAKTNDQANKPTLPTWLPVLVNGSHTNERTKGTNGDHE